MGFLSLSEVFYNRFFWKFLFGILFLIRQNPHKKNKVVFGRLIKAYFILIIFFYVFSSGIHTRYFNLLPTAFFLFLSPKIFLLTFLDVCQSFCTSRKVSKASLFRYLLPVTQKRKKKADILEK